MFNINNQKIPIAMVAITMLLFPIAVFITDPLHTALGLLFVLFFLSEWARVPTLGKAFSIPLTIAILSVKGSLSYIIATPKR